MKRIIATCAALALVMAAFTSCGSKPTENNRVNNVSSSSSSEETTVETTIEANSDPFEKIKYAIEDPENSVYPMDVNIIFDESEAGYGDNSPFTYKAIADKTGLRFKIEADPAITGNNETTEKIYFLPIEEMPCQLLNVEQITDDNKKSLIEKMNEEIGQLLSTQLETDMENKYKLEELYASIMEFDPQGTQQYSTEIKTYKTTDEWGDTTVDNTKKVVKLQSVSESYNSIIGIYKVNYNGNDYYSALICSNLIIRDSKFDLDSMEVRMKMTLYYLNNCLSDTYDTIYGDAVVNKPRANVSTEIPLT